MLSASRFCCVSGYRSGMAKSHVPRSEVAKGPKPPDLPKRIPKKTREALGLIIDQGITQREAAKRVGLNEAALSRTIRRPDVAAYIEYQKAEYLALHEELVGQAKAVALRQAIDLMVNAKAEATRVKLIELFTNEGKDKNPAPPAPSVNIALNGYAYAPKGAQIVDITPLDNDPDPTQE